MGMYVSFVRLTPAQLEQAEQDPEWAEQFLEDLYDSDTGPMPEGADADIQKSWSALDYVFDVAEVSFSVQDGGVCVAMGDGWYINAWSVHDVAAAAKVLRETSFDTMAEHCDAAALSRAKVYPLGHMWDAEDFDSLRYDFDTLKAFFIATAAAGDAAMMSFG